ncbi:hypothetical protein [Aliiglaciecola lipolytica]|uniref:Uncharacterized protein n=1 Tax=Aliiglaciecola lipolytica E3 TaxID=1127673 RepID=K6YBX2_9ALTE|nr:hypothetical protein [Aliiglaciecola lipolytica]GAC14148.1 hypothetical protein GLIP_1514 [Aliiglaciecola lipolytica E3]
MKCFQFVCPSHQSWVQEHPREAFQKVQEMTDYAEQLIQCGEYQSVISYLGTALETTEIIFDSRLESPQLTTKMTAITIMLANSYSAIGQTENASIFLRKIQQKLQRAVNCADGYATKVAFYKHCEKALVEANSSLFEANAFQPNIPISQLH